MPLLRQISFRLIDRTNRRAGLVCCGFLRGGVKLRMCSVGEHCTSTTYIPYKHLDRAGRWCFWGYDPVWDGRNATPVRMIGVTLHGVVFPEFFLAGEKMLPESVLMQTVDG